MAFDYSDWKAAVGKILGGLNEVNTYRGTTLAGRVTTLLNQYPVTDVVHQAIDGIFDAQVEAGQALNGWVSYLSSLLLDTTVRNLNADRALLDESLAGAIKELDRRMRVDAQSFNDCPSTVTNANIGSPAGDHQFVWNRYEFTGHVSDYMVPDVYLIQLTADRSQGGTRWAETFSITGKPADSLPTDASYPSGTGFSGSDSAIDPGSDFGVVVDGTFDEWEDDGVTPTNWTISTGTAGTTVTRVANDARDGAAGFALSLVGDGATLHKVRQEITLDALQTYNVHFRVYDAADPGTDWAVSLMLVDSTGAAVVGPGSFSNVVTSGSATALASSWANPVTGQFIAPAVLPINGIFLEIRFHQNGSTTTAAVNTANAYVDHVSIQAVDPLYAGGPGLTIFSGITEGVVGDTRTATVALSSGVVGDFVIRGLDRLLGLASLETRLPTVTGGAETIADSVIG